MFHFHTAWKHQKTSSFLCFQGIQKCYIGWKWVNLPIPVRAHARIYTNWILHKKNSLSSLQREGEQIVKHGRQQVLLLQNDDLCIALKNSLIVMGKKCTHSLLWQCTSKLNNLKENHFNIDLSYSYSKNECWRSYVDQWILIMGVHYWIVIIQQLISVLIASRNSYTLGLVFCQIQLCFN